VCPNGEQFSLLQGIKQGTEKFCETHPAIPNVSGEGCPE
jgi:hypothetical protein